MQQAITWIKDDLVNWRIHVNAALGVGGGGGGELQEKTFSSLDENF